MKANYTFAAGGIAAVATSLRRRPFLEGRTPPTRKCVQNEYILSTKGGGWYSFSETV